ncbi:MAG: rfaG 1 [Chthoniobacteraceae bacterium]|nr:rfaG 1 [Chthoniobacteraceae bacterium]
MSRIKIVHVITGLTIGGAEMMLLNLLSRMEDSRFETSVISLTAGGRICTAIEALGINVMSLEMQQGRPSIKAAALLLKYLRSQKPDLIQGWMYHGNLAAQLCGTLLRIPVCWCIQNSFCSFASEKPLTRLVIKIMARLSGSAAKIVFVSHVARSQHARLGFQTRSSCVIPNGVDPSIFEPDFSARLSVREELGVSSAARLIGLIGRYHPQKDHETFLRAAEFLASTRNDVHFVLAGTNVDNDNPAFKRFLSSPSLLGRLHLMGERSDMARLMAGLDIATSSSSYGEALSLAVAESMACAVPCVVTDVGDSGSLVGDTGIIVPPRDARMLSQGWEQLLAIGDSALRSMGEAARRRIEEHYSLNGISHMYCEMYNSLI